MQRSKSLLSVTGHGGGRRLGTAAAVAGWPGAQYDGIVAFGACDHCRRGPGVDLMAVVTLIAGIGCLLAGLLAIGFGIPVKEFSFGNTLILAGAVAACTGLVLLGMWSVLRELQAISRRLDFGIPLEAGESTLQPAALTQLREVAEGRDSLFGRDDHAEPDLHRAASSRSELPRSVEPVEAAPAPKPRRNLMFSSTRRERERAQARPDEPSAAAGASEEQPPVTVLKSGVVDGMAYSLYSDGSIEAQMPEGMMRFASIDELRAHLDQRP
jgi:hypothetical protein